MTSPKVPGATQCALLAALLLGVACAPGVSIYGPAAAPQSAEDRDRAAQRDLEKARQLQSEERLGAALDAVERGLARDPSDPQLRAKLHRLGAQLNQRHQGRHEAAAWHRARAEELDPTPPPPPDTPLDADASGLLIVLLPPEEIDARSRSIERPNALGDWPDGVVATTLETRFETRLRAASVVALGSNEHPSAQSIASARAWLAEREPRAVLTLRVLRTYCSQSARDGPFSVVWVRIAAAAPSAAAFAPEVVRFVRTPSSGSIEPQEACEREALTQAVEQLIAGPAFRAAFEAPTPNTSQTLTRGELLDLFPALRKRIADAVDRGRLLFQNGQLADARDAFAGALAIDPEDPDARVYMAEVASTLAIAAQLDGLSGKRASSGFDPGLSGEEQERINIELSEQQRQRDELLAALAVLEGEPNLPAELDLSALEPAKITDPHGLGPTLARRYAGDAVEARTLRAPDGSVIARYFVAPDAAGVVLREEDTSGDGRPDRFTAYRDRERSEVWESKSGSSAIERHVSYAAGGTEVERIEFDTNGDGQIDRLLRYRGGALASEMRDGDGDGRLDTTDQFDAAGRLVQRDEDRNGNGETDVRSHYRNGRLVQREVLDPSLARGMRRGEAR